MRKTKSIVLCIGFCTLGKLAFGAETPTTRVNVPSEKLAALSVFTSAGFLSTAGGGGGAVLSTGLRLGLGRRFALGFDTGYGLLATGSGTMQDRWWFVPSAAVVFPGRIGKYPTSFDVGIGLGLGTSSGYSGGLAEYVASPLAASWEFQLVPTGRAHAIYSVRVSPSVEVFGRVEAAALVLPRGSNASPTDSTWLMFSLGTRFDLW